MCETGGMMSVRVRWEDVMTRDVDVGGAVPLCVSATLEGTYEVEVM